MGRLVAGLTVMGLAATTMAEEPKQVVSPKDTGDRVIALGTRVRLSLSPRGTDPLVGTLIGLDDEFFSVETRASKTERVARQFVTRVESSRGGRSRGRWAGRGALIGAGVGALVGFAAGENCSPGMWICFPRETTGFAGAVLLAPVGALVGFAVSGGERWQRLPNGNAQLSLAPVPTRGRGVGLRLALAF